MEHEFLSGLAAILIFGIGAQLLAGHLRVPSILLLLPAGVIAGPVLGLLHPDELFGELLFPLISLAVGVLLFEGGLSLCLDELRPVRSVVGRLVTVGVLATWLIGGFAAMLVFELPAQQALLLSGVLSVSGPTVVIPLIRQIRPREPIGTILRWEGIVIDPVGALLALVVLNVIVQRGETVWSTGLSVLLTIVAGTLAGLGAAWILALGLRTFTIPDHLQNPVALLLAVAAFVVADLVRSEAGLFATTVMGIAVANQRMAPTSHITEFQEELGPLLLAGLFVVLGARVELDSLPANLLPALVLVVVLTVIARPIAVWTSTIGAGLQLAHRAMLAVVAPRGIVAAAVASLFALRLEEHGTAFADLVPATFLVIGGTVVLAGVLAPIAAPRLDVARSEPTGIALVGSEPWLLDAAHHLARLGATVLVVTPEGADPEAERPLGVDVYDGRLSDEALLDRLDEDGIGIALVASRNQELNQYALIRMVEGLGRDRVYLLPARETEHRGGSYEDESRGSGAAFWARTPFGTDLHQTAIAVALDMGAEVTSYDSWVTLEHRDLPLVLFTIDASGAVRIHSQPSVQPERGARVIALELPTPDPTRELSNRTREVGEQNTALERKNGSGGDAEPAADEHVSAEQLSAGEAISGTVETDR